MRHRNYDTGEARNQLGHRGRRAVSSNLAVCNLLASPLIPWLSLLLFPFCAFGLKAVHTPKSITLHGIIFSSRFGGAALIDDAATNDAATNDIGGAAVTEGR